MDIWGILVILAVIGLLVYFLVIKKEPKQPVLIDPDTITEIEDVPGQPKK